jgi:S1-C subfamily serine protease
VRKLILSAAWLATCIAGKAAVDSSGTPTSFFAAEKRAVVEIACFNSKSDWYQGTGFFINDHEIITNFHVVRHLYGSSYHKIKVRLYDGRVVAVKAVTHRQPTLDLASLAVAPGTSRYWVTFRDDSGTLTRGDSAIAIGYPDDHFYIGGGSIEDISPMGIMFLMSGWADHGESGSPVFDDNHEVIGILKAIPQDGSHKGFVVSSNVILEGLQITNSAHPSSINSGTLYGVDLRNDADKDFDASNNITSK